MSIDISSPALQHAWSTIQDPQSSDSYLVLAYPPASSSSSSSSQYTPTSPQSPRWPDGSTDASRARDRRSDADADGPSSSKIRLELVACGDLTSMRKRSRGHQYAKPSQYRQHSHTASASSAATTSSSLGSGADGTAGTAATAAFAPEEERLEDGLALAAIRKHFVASTVKFAILKLREKYLLVQFISNDIDPIRRAHALVHGRGLAYQMPSPHTTTVVSRPSELTPALVFTRLEIDPSSIILLQRATVMAETNKSQHGTPPFMGGDRELPPLPPLPFSPSSTPVTTSSSPTSPWSEHSASASPASSFSFGGGGGGGAAGGGVGGTSRGRRNDVRVPPLPPLPPTTEKPSATEAVGRRREPQASDPFARPSMARSSSRPGRSRRRMGTQSSHVSTEQDAPAGANADETAAGAAGEREGVGAGVGGSRGGGASSGVGSRSDSRQQGHLGLPISEPATPRSPRSPALSDVSISSDQPQVVAVTSRTSAGPATAAPLRIRKKVHGRTASRADEAVVQGRRVDEWEKASRAHEAASESPRDSTKGAGGTAPLILPYLRSRDDSGVQMTAQGKPDNLPNSTQTSRTGDQYQHHASSRDAKPSTSASPATSMASGSTYRPGAKLPQWESQQQSTWSTGIALSMHTRGHDARPRPGEQRDGPPSDNSSWRPDGDAVPRPPQVPPTPAHAASRELNGFAHSQLRFSRSLPTLDFSSGNGVSRAPPRQQLPPPPGASLASSSPRLRHSNDEEFTSTGRMISDSSWGAAMARQRQDHHSQPNHQHYQQEQPEGWLSPRSAPHRIDLPRQMGAVPESSTSRSTKKDMDAALPPTPSPPPPPPLPLPPPPPTAAAASAPPPPSWAAAAMERPPTMTASAAAALAERERERRREAERRRIDEEKRRQVMTKLLREQIQWAEQEVSLKSADSDVSVVPSPIESLLTLAPGTPLSPAVSLPRSPAVPSKHFGDLQYPSSGRGASNEAHRAQGLASAGSGGAVNHTGTSKREESWPRRVREGYEEAHPHARPTAVAKARHPHPPLSSRARAEHDAAYAQLTGEAPPVHDDYGEEEAAHNQRQNRGRATESHDDDPSNLDYGPDGSMLGVDVREPQRRARRLEEQGYDGESWVSRQVRRQSSERVVEWAEAEKQRLRSKPAKSSRRKEDHEGGTSASKSPSSSHRHARRHEDHRGANETSDRDASRRHRQESRGQRHRREHQGSSDSEAHAAADDVDDALWRAFEAGQAAQAQLERTRAEHRRLTVLVSQTERRLRERDEMESLARAKWAREQAERMRLDAFERSRLEAEERRRREHVQRLQEEEAMRAEAVRREKELMAREEMAAAEFVRRRKRDAEAREAWLRAEAERAERRREQEEARTRQKLERRNTLKDEAKVKARAAKRRDEARKKKKHRKKGDGRRRRDDHSRSTRSRDGDDRGVRSRSSQEELTSGSGARASSPRSSSSRRRHGSDASSSDRPHSRKHRDDASRTSSRRQSRERRTDVRADDEGSRRRHRQGDADAHEDRRHQHKGGLGSSVASEPREELEEEVLDDAEDEDDDETHAGSDDRDVYLLSGYVDVSLDDHPWRRRWFTLSYSIWSFYKSQERAAAHEPPVEEIDLRRPNTLVRLDEGFEAAELPMPNAFGVVLDASRSGGFEAVLVSMSTADEREALIASLLAAAEIADETGSVVSGS